MNRIALVFCALACFGGAARAEGPAVPPAFDGVLRDGITQAKNYLDAQDSFMPFALLQNKDGKTHSILPQTGAELNAPRDTELERNPADAVRVMNERVKRETAKGGYAVVAILTDDEVKLPDGSVSDAIRVGLESPSGPCVDVFVPYHRDTSGDVLFEGEKQRVTAPRQGTVFGCK